MKKVLLVAVAGLFVLASCKKDYTCECTFSGAGAGMAAITIPIKDAKKKDATATCDAATTTYSSVGGKCVIK